METLSRTGLEVWSDEPSGKNPPHVTLYFGDWSEYVNLTPNEARALAAVLVSAAVHQERRLALSNPHHDATRA